MTNRPEQPYGDGAPRRGPRRSPRPVADAVSRIRERVAPATPLAGVQDRWHDVVGPEIAAHAIPVSERNGVVTVACDSSVWAAELEMMAATLLERLDSDPASPASVTSLRFVTGGPQR